MSNEQYSNTDFEVAAINLDMWLNATAMLRLAQQTDVLADEGWEQKADAIVDQTMTTAGTRYGAQWLDDFLKLADFYQVAISKRNMLSLAGMTARLNSIASGTKEANKEKYEFYVEAVHNIDNMLLQLCYDYLYTGVLPPLDLDYLLERHRKHIDDTNSEE